MARLGAADRTRTKRIRWGRVIITVLTILLSTSLLLTALNLPALGGRLVWFWSSERHLPPPETGPFRFGGHYVEPTYVRDVVRVPWPHHELSYGLSYSHQKEFFYSYFLENAEAPFVRVHEIKVDARFLNVEPLLGKEGARSTHDLQADQLGEFEPFDLRKGQKRLIVYRLRFDNCQTETSSQSFGGTRNPSFTIDTGALRRRLDLDSPIELLVAVNPGDCPSPSVFDVPVIESPANLGLACSEDKRRTVSASLSGKEPVEVLNRAFDSYNPRVFDGIQFKQFMTDPNSVVFLGTRPTGDSRNPDRVEMIFPVKPLDDAWVSLEHRICKELTAKLPEWAPVNL